MATQIQIRRGTASAWTTANPVLALGEMGLETDTRQFKFGDGATAWAALAYASAGGGGSVTAAGITDATTAGRNMLTAADLAAQRLLLGIPTYANVTAANAALAIGQIYFDTALQTLNTVTL